MQPHSAQLIKFISLSVLAHILIIFVLVNLEDNEPAKKKVVAKKPQIIKAKLIYQKNQVKPKLKLKKKTKPKELKKTAEKAVTKTAQVTSKKTDKHTPKKQKVNQQKVKEQKVKEQKIKEQKVQSNKTQKNKTQKNKEPQIKTAKKEIDKSKTREAEIQKNKPIVNSNVKANIKAATKQYFSTIPEPPPFEAQFSNSSTSIMAINNKAKAVPTFSKRVDNTGEMGKPRPTKVLCDETLGATVAFMSGLTGGTVQCEPLPDVREFLKNRNKNKR